METKTLRRAIIGIVVLAIGIFLLISLVTHNPAEGPFPDYSARPARANACGVVGAYASAYAFAAIGYTAFPLAALIAAVGLMVLFQVKPKGLVIRVSGLAMLTAAAMVALSLLNTSSTAPSGRYEPQLGLGGGILGLFLVRALYRAVGPSGTVILLACTAAVGALLAAGEELLALGGALRRAVARKGSSRGFAPMGWLAAIWPGRRKGRPARRAAEPVTMHEAAPADAGPVLLRPSPVEPAAARRPEPEPESDEGPAAEGESVEVALPEAPAEPVIVSRSGQPFESEDDDVDDEDLDVHELTGREPGDFRLPPPALLDEVQQAGPIEDEAEIREKGHMLERTLSEFKVEARVVRVQHGPVITMYELSLAPGTKVSKVESLSDDLAIALKAPNVRIVAPLPGRNTVGIEVPNAERDIVGMRELLDEAGSKAGKMAIPLFLGKDTAGNPLILDLARCPHLLVAGATGAGKSVAINAMIMSILMTRTPEEVQLLLVDPKSVEFTQYTQLPHLICPVLSDMKKAASVLKWACKKMDERYSLLSQVGERDLKGYNDLGEEEIIRRLDPDGDAVLDDVPFHMPHIVIIVDEFGELMMVAAKEVESSVIRLSQKARAVGIHLICATQRPSVDVITGLIKSNLPARVAFQVASKVDSRTILDRNGAELLLGRGDMLLLPPGTSRLVRAQGSYVSEEEINRIVGFLESQGAPQFKAELREYQAQHEGGAEASDELYEDAVRIVLETQRGSVSLLQRRLGIGYSRAARLIDMMAEAGVVGQYRGSQARRVLMSLGQWDATHAAKEAS